MRLHAARERGRAARVGGAPGDVGVAVLVESPALRDLAVLSLRRVGLTARGAAASGRHARQPAQARPRGDSGDEGCAPFSAAATGATSACSASCSPSSQRALAEALTSELRLPGRAPGPFAEPPRRRRGAPPRALTQSRPSCGSRSRATACPAPAGDMVVARREPRAQRRRLIEPRRAPHFRAARDGRAIVPRRGRGRPHPPPTPALAHGPPLTPAFDLAGPDRERLVVSPAGAVAHALRASPRATGPSPTGSRRPSRPGRRLPRPHGRAPPRRPGLARVRAQGPRSSPRRSSVG